MRRLVLAFLLAASAGAACSDDPPNDTATDASRSGVGIVAEGCSLVAQLGSGVALGQPGHVVTAAHTIAGTTTITVVDESGVEHAATVRAFDPDADLAVLHATTLSAPSLPLSPTSPTGPGSIVVWNRDDGVVMRPVDITRRLSITIEDIYVDNAVLRSGIEFAGLVEIGDSGGAVLGQGGAVVGIVYANSRQRGGIGFATDVAEISELLASVNADEVENGRCV